MDKHINTLECQERGSKPHGMGGSGEPARHSCLSTPEIGAEGRAKTDGKSREVPRSSPIIVPVRGALSERFWSKVRKGRRDECWPWLASSRGVGYGAFKVGNKVIDAHRFAYELHHGAAPLPGIWICHKCDNRACCNPAHLVAGTPLDNHGDMVARGRRVDPTVVSERNKRLGIKPPRTTKLTDEQAALVIALASQGLRHYTIAERVGVCRASVSKIIAGTQWPDLDRSALATMAAPPPVVRIGIGLGQQKVCGQCGGLGHNRRTCSASEAA